MSDKPDYLLVDDFLFPIKSAIDEFKAIHTDIDSLDKEYLKKGVFVYVVSLFESSLFEYSKKYFLSFPKEINGGKIDGREINYILNSTYTIEVVEMLIDDILQQESYSNIISIISQICKTLDVEKKVLGFKDKELIEIKERRNIVVHNNSIVDKKYIRNTSSSTSELGSAKKITKEYLSYSIEIIQHILIKVEELIKNKFSEYGKEKLIKSIWCYFFNSPLLNFDNYCRIYEGKFQFHSIDNIIKIKGSLSSSEKSLLAYFIQNYSPSLCDSYFKFKDLNLQVSTTKMKELVEVFERYPLLLQ